MSKMSKCVVFLSIERKWGKETVFHLVSEATELTVKNIFHVPVEISFHQEICGYRKLDLFINLQIYQN